MTLNRAGLESFAKTPRLRLDGQVVIVTGGGRGLGRAHALELASRGAMVVVNDLGEIAAGGAQRGPLRSQAVVDEIIALGGQAVANGDDISSELGAQRLVDCALSAFGNLHVVVNNAGVLHSGHFADTKRAELERTIAVHLYGTWGVTQAAWPVMEKQRYGRIIVTTSAAGLQGIAHPPMAAYGAAKGALTALALSLAAERAAVGIRVNALAPRAFTPLQSEHMTDPGVAAGLAAAQPAGAVSPIVTVLAHESCPVNGVVLFAGGGRVCRPFMAESMGIADALGLTAEQVCDALPSILDIEGFTVPKPYSASPAMR